MELRHLRYVIAVADELHFSRAAEKLGIGQPPLSQQVKQLEKEIGTKLFYRKTRGIELTEAGRAFLPHARAALQSASSALVCARQAARGEAGSIRVGFTGSAIFNPLVTEIIHRFRDKYPSLIVSLVEQTTTSLLEALRTSNIDLAFLRPARSELDGLAVRKLPDEELWIALHKVHPLARRREIRLAELSCEPFVLFPRANGRLLYDSVIAACLNAGFSPRIIQDAPQLTSTVNLVAAGLGVALVPASMCIDRRERVNYVRIAGDAVRAELWVAHRMTGPIPASVRNFMDCVAALT